MDFMSYSYVIYEAPLEKNRIKDILDQSFIGFHETYIHIAFFWLIFELYYAYD